MVLLYRHFGFIEPLCQWLPLVDIFEAYFTPVRTTNSHTELFQSAETWLEPIKHLRWSFFAKYFKA